MSNNDNPINPVTNAQQIVLGPDGIIQNTKPSNNPTFSQDIGSSDNFTIDNKGQTVPTEAEARLIGNEEKPSSTISNWVNSIERIPYLAPKITGGIVGVFGDLIEGGGIFLEETKETISPVFADYLKSNVPNIAKTKLYDWLVEVNHNHAPVTNFFQDIKNSVDKQEPTPSTSFAKHNIYQGYDWTLNQLFEVGKFMAEAYLLGKIIPTNFGVMDKLKQMSPLVEDVTNGAETILNSTKIGSKTLQALSANNIGNSYTLAGLMAMESSNNVYKEVYDKKYKEYLTSSTPDMADRLAYEDALKAANKNLLLETAITGSIFIIGGITHFLPTTEKEIAAKINRRYLEELAKNPNGDANELLKNIEDEITTKQESTTLLGKTGKLTIPFFRRGLQDASQFYGMHISSMYAKEQGEEAGGVLSKDKAKSIPNMIASGEGLKSALSGLVMGYMFAGKDFLIPAREGKYETIDNPDGTQTLKPITEQTKDKRFGLLPKTDKEGKPIMKDTQVKGKYAIKFNISENRIVKLQKVILHNIRNDFGNVSEWLNQYRTTISELKNESDLVKKQGLELKLKSIKDKLSDVDVKFSIRHGMADSMVKTLENLRDVDNETVINDKGETEAMVRGLAESPEDNGYNSVIEEKIKTVKDLEKEHRELLRKYYWLDKEGTTGIFDYLFDIKSDIYGLTKHLDLLNKHLSDINEEINRTPTMIGNFDVRRAVEINDKILGINNILKTYDNEFGIDTNNIKDIQNAKKALEDKLKEYHSELNNLYSTFIDNLPDLKYKPDEEALSSKMSVLEDLRKERGATINDAAREMVDSRIAKLDAEIRDEQKRLESKFKDDWAETIINGSTNNHIRQQLEGKIAYHNNVKDALTELFNGVTSEQGKDKFVKKFESTLKKEQAEMLEKDRDNLKDKISNIKGSPVEVLPELIKLKNNSEYKDKKDLQNIIQKSIDDIKEQILKDKLTTDNKVLVDKAEQERLEAETKLKIEQDKKDKTNKKEKETKEEKEEPGIVDTFIPHTDKNYEIKTFIDDTQDIDSIHIPNFIDTKSTNPDGSENKNFGALELNDRDAKIYNLLTDPTIDISKVNSVFVINIDHMIRNKVVKDIPASIKTVGELMDFIKDPNKREELINNLAITVRDADNIEQNTAIHIAKRSYYTNKSPKKGEIGEIAFTDNLITNYIKPSTINDLIADSKTITDAYNIIHKNKGTGNQASDTKIINAARHTVVKILDKIFPGKFTSDEIEALNVTQNEYGRDRLIKHLYNLLTFDLNNKKDIEDIKKTGKDNLIKSVETWRTKLATDAAGTNNIVYSLLKQLEEKDSKTPLNQVQVRTKLQRLNNGSFLNTSGRVPIKDNFVDWTDENKYSISDRANDKATHEDGIFYFVVRETPAGKVTPIPILSFGNLNDKEVNELWDTTDKVIKVLIEQKDSIIKDNKRYTSPLISNLLKEASKYVMYDKKVKDGKGNQITSFKYNTSMYNGDIANYRGEITVVEAELNNKLVTVTLQKDNTFRVVGVGDKFIDNLNLDELKVIFKTAFVNKRRNINEHTFVLPEGTNTWKLQNRDMNDIYSEVKDLIEDGRAVTNVGRVTHNGKTLGHFVPKGDRNLVITAESDINREKDTYILSTKGESKAIKTEKQIAIDKAKEKVTEEGIRESTRITAEYHAIKTNLDNNEISADIFGNIIKNITTKPYSSKGWLDIQISNLEALLKTTPDSAKKNILELGINVLKDKFKEFNEVKEAKPTVVNPIITIDGETETGLKHRDAINKLITKGKNIGNNTEEEIEAYREAHGEFLMSNGEKWTRDKLEKEYGIRHSEELTRDIAPDYFKTYIDKEEVKPLINNTIGDIGEFQQNSSFNTISKSSITQATEEANKINLEQYRNTNPTYIYEAYDELQNKYPHLNFKFNIDTEHRSTDIFQKRPKIEVLDVNKDYTLDKLGNWIKSPSIANKEAFDNLIDFLIKKSSNTLNIKFDNVGNETRDITKDNSIRLSSRHALLDTSIHGVAHLLLPKIKEINPEGYNNLKKEVDRLWAISKDAKSLLSRVYSSNLYATDGVLNDRGYQEAMAEITGEKGKKILEGKYGKDLKGIIGKLWDLVRDFFRKASGKPLDILSKDLTDIKIGDIARWIVDSPSEIDLSDSKVDTENQKIDINYNQVPGFSKAEQDEAIELVSAVADKYKQAAKNADIKNHDLKTDVVNWLKNRANDRKEEYHTKYLNKVADAIESSDKNSKDYNRSLWSKIEDEYTIAYKSKLTIEDSEEKGGASRTFGDNTGESSLFSNIPKNVVSFLRTSPLIGKDGNRVISPLTGMGKFIDYKEVFNTFISKENGLVNSVDLNNMFYKMGKLVSNLPSVKNMLDTLKDDKNKELASLFYTTFNKYFSNDRRVELIKKREKGGVESLTFKQYPAYKAMETRYADEVLLRLALARQSWLKEDRQSFYDTIDKKVGNGREGLLNVKSFITTTDSKGNIEYKTSIADKELNTIIKGIQNVYDKIGFTISKEELLRYVNNNGNDGLKKLYTTFIESLPHIIKHIEAESDKEGNSKYGIMGDTALPAKVGKAIASLRTTNRESTYLDGEGKQHYPNIEPFFLSDIINKYNSTNPDVQKEVEVEINRKKLIPGLRKSNWIEGYNRPYEIFNRLNIHILGWIKDSTGDTAKYSTMTDTDWKMWNFFGYIDSSINKESGFPALSLPIFSDSSKAISIEAPIINIVENGASQFMGTTNSIRRTSKLYKAISNTFLQELDMMVQARNEMFTYDDTKKEWVIKDGISSGLDNNYHFTFDKDNNIQYFKDGKVTGRVFKFHNIPEINDVVLEDGTSLFDKQGVLRENISIDHIPDVFKESIYTTIDKFIQDMVSNDIKTHADFKEPFLDKYKHIGTIPNPDVRFKEVIAEYSLNRFITNVEVGNHFLGVDAEYKSSDDKNKRAKELVSPRSSLSGLFLPKELNNIAIHDIKSKSDIADYIEEQLKGKVKDKLLVDIMFMYRDINSTDGHEHWTEDIDIRYRLEIGEGDNLKGFIELKPNGQYKYINLDRINAPILTPHKLYYYDRSFNKELNQYFSIQIKSSISVLNDVIAPYDTPLGKIRKTMEDNNIHKLSFLSTIKEGATNVGTIKDNDTENSIKSTPISKIYISNLGKQQNVVPHVEDTNISISKQSKIIAISNLFDKAKYTISAKSYGGKELFRHYNDVTNSIVDRLSEKLVSDLKDSKALARILQESSKVYGINDNNRLSYTLDEDGKFHMSLNDPQSVNKNEQVLTSLFTNRVTNFNVKGAHVTLIPNSLRGDKKFKTIIENGQVIHKVALSAWSKEFYNKDGKLIDAKDLPDSMKYIYGYRTPYSGKHSGAIFKVVEILPKSSGSIIIAPDHLIAQMGYDFDIDSLYLHLPNFYKKGDGSFKAHEFSTSEADTPNRYRQYVLSSIKDKESKELLKQTEQAIYEELNEELELEPDKETGKILKEQANKEKLEAIEKLANANGLNDLATFSRRNIYDQNSKEALENEIINVYKSIYGNDNHLFEQISPAYYKEPKESADKIDAIINKGKDKTYNKGSVQDVYREINLGGKQNLEIMAAINPIFRILQETRAKLTEVYAITRKYSLKDLESRVHITLDELQKKYDVEIDEKNSDIVTIKHKNLGYTNDNGYVGMFGDSIADRLGQGVDYMADIVKAGSPTNFNKYTVNLVNALIIADGDYDYAYNFIAQQAIRDLSKIGSDESLLYGNKGKTKFEVSKTRDKYARLLYNAILEDNPEAIIPITDTMKVNLAKKNYDYNIFGNKTINTLSDYYIKDSTTYTVPEMLDILKKGVDIDNLSAKDKIEYYKAQLHLIDEFEKYNKTGKVIGGASHRLNSYKLGAGANVFENKQYIQDILNDTSYDSDIEDFVDNQGIVINGESYQKAIYPNLFGINREAEYPSLQNYLKKSNQAAINTISKNFIVDSHTGTDILNGVISQLGIFDGKKKSSAYKKVQTHLLYSTLKKSPLLRIDNNEFNTLVGIRENTKVTKPTKDINFTDFKNLSVAEQTEVQKLRHELNGDEKHILNYLEPKLSEFYIKKNGFHFIDVKDVFNEPGIDNILTKSFKELYEGNKFDIEYAKNLIKYNYTTFGFAYSNNSFSKWIPKEILINEGIGDILNNASDNYYHGNETFSPDMIDKIIRNNPTLISRVKTETRIVKDSQTGRTYGVRKDGHPDWNPKLEKGEDDILHKHIRFSAKPYDESKPETRYGLDYSKIDKKELQTEYIKVWNKKDLKDDIYRKLHHNMEDEGFVYIPVESLGSWNLIEDSETSNLDKNKTDDSVEGLLKYLKDKYGIIPKSNDEKSSQYTIDNPPPTPQIDGSGVTTESPLEERNIQPQSTSDTPTLSQDKYVGQEFDEEENNLLYNSNKPTKPTSITLNKEQQIGVDKAIDFIKNGNSNEFFVISGKAGTGKTTIATEIAKQFPNKKVDIIALSNKAKKVISDKFEAEKIPARSSSIAGFLGLNMNLETGKFEEAKNAQNAPPVYSSQIIIIDEGSMVNEEMIDKIFDKKPKDAKVIMLGDIGQLPPIRTNENPYYKGKGEMFTKKSPIFDSKNRHDLLERVRQGEESPILPYADYFWENSQKDKPEANPVKEKKTIVNDKGALIFTNSFNDIKHDVLDAFKAAVLDKNPNYIKVVSYRNDNRKEVNKYIHNNIFGSNSKQYNNGELIIFNDRYGEFDNSDEAIVNKSSETLQNYLGLEYITLNVTANGVTDEIDVLNENSKLKHDKLVSDLFKIAFDKKKIGDFSYKQAFKDAWTLKQRFANIDYGYAITSHKSQGSTYDMVIVNEKDIMGVSMINDANKSESIYTAITRARNVATVISSTLVENSNYNIENVNKDINANKGILPTGILGESKMNMKPPSDKTIQEQRKSQLPKEDVNKFKQKANYINTVFTKYGLNIPVIEDRTITGHANISTDKDGKFTIKFNPTDIRKDSLFHEWGHALIDIMGGLDNDFIKLGVEQLKGTKLWNDIHEVYGDRNDIVKQKEVLTTAIGMEADKLFDEKEKVGAFRFWVNRLIDKLSDILYKASGGRLGDKETVAKKLAMDLLKGRLRSSRSGKLVDYFNEQRKTLDEIYEDSKNYKLNEDNKYENIITHDKHDRVNDILSEYKDEFNKEEAIENFKSSTSDIVLKQKALGVNTSEEISKHWEDLAIMGSSVHKELSDYSNSLKEGKNIVSNLPDELKDLIKSMHENGKVYSEMTLVEHNHGSTNTVGIAGTPDILFVDNDGEHWILDYKVKARGKFEYFDSDNYASEFKGKLGEFLDGVKQSKSNEYAMALSTYNYLLRENLGTQVKAHLVIIPIEVDLKRNPDGSLGYENMTMGATIDNKYVKQLHINNYVDQLQDFFLDGSDVSTKLEAKIQLKRDEALRNRIVKMHQSSVDTINKLYSNIDKILEARNDFIDDEIVEGLKEQKTNLDAGLYNNRLKKAELVTESTLARDANKTLNLLNDNFKSISDTINYLYNKLDRHNFGSDYTGVKLHNLSDEEFKLLGDDVKEAQDLALTYEAINNFIGIRKIEDIENLTDTEKEINSLINDYGELYDKVRFIKNKADELLHKFLSSAVDRWSNNPKFKDVDLDTIKKYMGHIVDENTFQGWMNSVYHSHIPFVAFAGKRIWDQTLEGTKEASKAHADFFSHAADMIGDPKLKDKFTMLDRHSHKDAFNKFFDKNGKMLREFDYSSFEEDEQVMRDNAREEAIKDYEQMATNGIEELPDRDTYIRNKVKKTASAWYKLNTDEVPDAVKQRRIEEQLSNLSPEEYKKWFTSNFVGKKNYTVLGGEFRTPSDKYWSSEYHKLNPKELEFLSYLENTIKQYAGDFYKSGMMPAFYRDTVDFHTPERTEHYEATDIHGNVIYHIPFEGIMQFNSIPEIYLPNKNPGESNKEYEKRALDTVRDKGDGSYKSLKDIAEKNKEIDRENKKTNADALNRNLLEVMPKFISNAIKYRRMREVETELKLYAEALAHSTITDRKGNLKRSENSIAYNHVQDFLKMVVYGKFHTKRYADRPLSVIKGIAVHMGLGINVMSAAKLNMNMKLQRFIEAQTKEMGDHTANTKAEVLYNKDISSYILDVLRIDGKSSSLSNAIIKEFGVMFNAYEANELKRTGRIQGTFAYKMFSDGMFAFMHSTIHAAQAKNLFRHLYGHRVVNGKIINLVDYMQGKYPDIVKFGDNKTNKKEYDKQVNTIKETFKQYPTMMSQLYFEDGMVAYRQHIDEKELNSFKERVLFSNSKLHGRYNLVDMGIGEQYTWYKTLLTFGRWKKDGWDVRWGSRGAPITLKGKKLDLDMIETYNEKGKTMEVPAYKMFLKYYTTPFTKEHLAEFGYDNSHKGALAYTKALMEGYTNFVANAGLYWRDLTDYERAAVVRACTEMALAAVVFSVGQLLFKVADSIPKENKMERRILGGLIYITTGLVEPLLYFTPASPLFKNGNPISGPATLTTITRLLKVTNDLFGYTFGYDNSPRLKKGKYKGELKVTKDIDQTFPYTSQYFRLRDLDTHIDLNPYQFVWESEYANRRKKH